MYVPQAGQPPAPSPQRQQQQQQQQQQQEQQEQQEGGSLSAAWLQHEMEEWAALQSNCNGTWDERMGPLWDFCAGFKAALPASSLVGEALGNLLQRKQQPDQRQVQQQPKKQQPRQVLQRPKKQQPRQGQQEQAKKKRQR